MLVSSDWGLDWCHVATHNGDQPLTVSSSMSRYCCSMLHTFHTSIRLHTCSLPLYAPALSLYACTAPSSGGGGGDIGPIIGAVVGIILAVVVVVIVILIIVYFVRK